MLVYLASRCVVIRRDSMGRPIRVRPRGEAHGMARRTTIQARQVRERALRGENQHAIAADFGISNVTVSAIKRGRLWRGI